MNKLWQILQVSSVFIGTIVGAGLASGKEISQFFTCYGYISFIGILICGLLYIFLCSMFIKISLKYDLKSYTEFIRLISPGILGEAIDYITGFFLISGCAIILAGSGALINQYFGVSKWLGILVMLIPTIVVLMQNTKGLVSVNSIIVPSLVTIITIIFVLYVLFSKDSFNIYTLVLIPKSKNYWFFFTLLYTGFNMLSCSGVIVPLCHEYKNKFTLISGVTLGAVVLTLLCLAINFMLLLNVPYIYKYEIPLLYISNRFGKSIQILLLIIIWMEMFSTVISDIYSVAKALESSNSQSNLFKFSYKKSIFLVALIALPISQIGFSNLISFLYPGYGIISLLFLIQCTFFYLKNF